MADDPSGEDVRGGAKITHPRVMFPGRTVFCALGLKLLEEHPALVQHALRLKPRSGVQRSRKG